MNSVNKVTLIGNLGNDPQIINSEEGKKFVTFSLATHEFWKDKEGTPQQDTE